MNGPTLCVITRGKSPTDTAACSRASCCLNSTLLSCPAILLRSLVNPVCSTFERFPTLVKTTCHIHGTLPSKVTGVQSRSLHAVVSSHLPASEVDWFGRRVQKHVGHVCRPSNSQHHCVERPVNGHNKARPAEYRGKLHLHWRWKAVKERVPSLRSCEDVPSLRSCEETGVYEEWKRKKKPESTPLR